MVFGKNSLKEECGRRGGGNVLRWEKICTHVERNEKRSHDRIA